MTAAGLSLLALGATQLFQAMVRTQSEAQASHLFAKAWS